MIGISDIYNVNTAVDINLLCVAINFLFSLNVLRMQVSHSLRSRYDLTAKTQISLHGWATGIHTGSVTQSQNPKSQTHSITPNNLGTNRFTSSYMQFTYSQIYDIFFV